MDGDFWGSGRVSGNQGWGAGQGTHQRPLVGREDSEFLDHPITRRVLAALVLVLVIVLVIQLLI